MFLDVHGGKKLADDTLLLLLLINSSIIASLSNILYDHFTLTSPHLTSFLQLYISDFLNRFRIFPRSRIFFPYRERVEGIASHSMVV